MKTAVSIPDRIFRAAEKTAKRLGIPRSQLFARALEEFIGNHNRDSVTEKLNSVYQGVGAEKDDLLAVSLDRLRKATRNDAW